MTGWVGGGLIAGENFIRLAFIPFLMISAFIDSIKKQYVIFAIMIIASLLMVLNGHYQIISEDGIGWAGNAAVQTGSIRRINYLGYFSDPNDLGMYLIMMLPIVFLVKRELPMALGWVSWLVIGAILYGMAMTNSRGTILATAPLLSVWVWRSYGINRAVFLGILGSPIALFIFSRLRSIL